MGYQKGQFDGALIVADTATFGMIDSPHRETERRIEENGGLYYAARTSARVARAAGLAAGGIGTLGIRAAVGVAGVGGPYGFSSGVWHEVGQAIDHPGHRPSAGAILESTLTGAEVGVGLSLFPSLAVPVTLFAAQQIQAEGDAGD
jgi:hypothetical protein